MIIEHIGSSLLALLMSVSSLAGLSGDAVTAYAAQNGSAHQAQISESTTVKNNDSRFGSWSGWVWNRPSVQKIDPASSPVDTTVTLTGKKFTDDSVVRFGKGVINDTTVSDDGKTLTFVVPEYMGQYCPPNKVCTDIALEVMPDTYKVRVQDGNRTSNAVKFEVTEDDGSDNDKPFAISEIDGPSSLALGAEGTWTVDVKNDDDGSLQYGVTWGDEGLSSRMSLRASLAEVQSSATFTHTYENAGTFTPEFTVTDEEGNTITKLGAPVVVSDGAVPHIDAITPASSTVSSTITLTGTGFDTDGSTTVTIGDTLAKNVTISNDTKITFVVPTLATGTYAVVVKDSDGSSNSVTFSVIEKTVKGKISVSGVDAPVRLSLSEEGTWTVHTLSNVVGNLKYSVDWGEGNIFARSLLGAKIETQSEATFTHAYDNEGTYKPKFTVSDEAGHSASVSATVVVDGEGE